MYITHVLIGRSPCLNQAIQTRKLKGPSEEFETRLSLYRRIFLRFVNLRRSVLQLFELIVYKIYSFVRTKKKRSLLYELGRIYRCNLGEFSFRTFA